jgi:hypothetical protein
VECDSADGRTMRIGKLNKHSRDGRSVNVVMHGDFRTFPSQPDSNGRRPKLHTMIRFASSDERHSHLSVGSPLQLNQYCQKKSIFSILFCRARPSRLRERWRLAAPVFVPWTSILDPSFHCRKRPKSIGDERQTFTA